MLPFALTIFLGAFLLFQVQPMIGKFILPWFGGGPGIWTTCMLFFQLLLLGGYAYAHVLTRYLRPRRQVVVHLILMAAALLLLPITPSDSWKPRAGGDPRPQILLLLTACVGLPYFVLSATGPLMQQWFSRLRPTASPYRLYALSNTGSLLALVSYPFLFEIHFSRGTQASFWAAGLAGFVVCAAACAFQLWKTAGTPATATGSKITATRDEASVPRLNKGLWLALPACASTLLIAFTNKICQDVAVIPFLWVVPLAIYLFSFILCFDSPRWYRRGPYAALLLLAFGLICWSLYSADERSLQLQLAAYCGGLFICCMVCHGELYLLRPPPAQLTSYYLMIAAGGALGGIFVTMGAPLLFTDYFELHWGTLLCGAFFVIAWMFNPQPGRFGRLNLSGRAAGWAMVILLGMALYSHSRKSAEAILERTRNFYGVLTLYHEDPSQSGLTGLRLSHGVTTHGLQLADPALSRLSTTYYGENSGVGRAFAASAGHPRRIGVIGLGAGTLAAYAQADDVLRIYEINPEVERLARSRFTYLSNCAGRVEIVLGDARLSLDSEPVQNFDLLVVDAFSSDAIPMHLLTREAFDLYRRHLRTNGVVAVHISNRHLDLEPVVAEAAERIQWGAALIKDEAPNDQWWLNSSLWMILSGDERTLRHPSIASVSRPGRSDPARVPLWTDDYASLYPIVSHKTPPRRNLRPAEARAAMGATLAQHGDWTGAISRYRSALDLEPNLIGALNNLAWLLATAPDGAVRNGREAVGLAERACRLAEYRRTLLLGTLAAAYAEAGQFTEAVTAAERACKLAAESGEEVLLTRNRQLLELYQSGKPYHEPAVGSAAP